jgi:hypothetical protein
VRRPDVPVSVCPLASVRVRGGGFLPGPSRLRVCILGADGSDHEGVCGRPPPVRGARGRRGGDVRKGQRKDDIAHEYLAGFEGEEGVLFVGKAQEKTTTFRTEKRVNPETGRSYWRSARRLGSDVDALWVRRRGQQLTDEETRQLAALRRLASILGVHFLEDEGDDLVDAVRRVAHERGSTYVFVCTPDESRRREIFGGSLLSRMVRELRGIDIRVVADRADRQELAP